MACGIYKITNQINGKNYIGQSVDIKTRWRKHKESKKDYPLYRAFRKYGIDNFTFEILEECPILELNAKEQYYIEKYNAIKNGYNQKIVFDDGIVLEVPDYVHKIIDDLINFKDLSTDKIAEMNNVSGTTVRAINRGAAWIQEDISYPIRHPFENVRKRPRFCKVCGEPINTGIKYCSEKCSQIASRKVQRPSREELKEYIRTTPFTQIGAAYGVTDNAVRKWCVAENLPSRVSEIKQYSEEDWNKI